MAIAIPPNDWLSAYAIIVDINSFTSIVNKGSELIAQEIRDVLVGAISVVEAYGGEVVAFMGDAFLALISDTSNVATCCFGIARDFDKQHEYFTYMASDFPNYPLGGPTVKIGIEYGLMNVSEIKSKFLGMQKIFIGSAINYASRITKAGKGNRCLLGPQAANKLIDIYEERNSIIEGPFDINGEKGEGKYVY